MSYLMVPCFDILGSLLACFSYFCRCHHGRMPGLVKCHLTHVKMTRHLTNRCFSGGDGKQTSTVLISYSQFLFCLCDILSQRSDACRMSGFYAAKINIFGALKDGGQNFEVCDTGEDVSWLDFLRDCCSTDVLLK